LSLPSTMPSSKFKPFIAHAKCCDSLLLLLKPRVYVACTCLKTAVDAGDGHYHRMNIHEGVEMPRFYSQKKKGSFVMVSGRKKGRKV
jgi:hypothetical protein